MYQFVTDQLTICFHETNGIDFLNFLEFHLTIPVESIRDEVIEKHLLQEESINVLKSNILKCRHHPEDFETILKQPDQRFSEMNVLGIVPMKTAIMIL